MIHKWNIKEIIGKGVDSQVYRIESTLDKKEQYALKHIKNINTDSITEPNIMIKLSNCNNIVHCYEYEITKSDIYIRMELLTPLTKYISNNLINGMFVAKLGADISKAVEYCEKYNIVHRDIKPNNIFVNSEGRFKLGDFGAAVNLSEPINKKMLTFTYAAPELIKDIAYDSKADIYSLGLVMYRLLNNNRMPFMPPYPKPFSVADKNRAVSKRMKNYKINPPVNGDNNLKNIVLKACEYSEENRYSPYEMRIALENIIYK